MDGVINIPQVFIFKRQRSVLHIGKKAASPAGTESDLRHYTTLANQLETGNLQVRNADEPDAQTPTWKVILTHDGSRTLQLCGSDVTFHSTSGAATESLHVFVHNSGIFENPEASKLIRILEIGFGTGLNFLLTVDEAARRNRSIEYIAIDQMLLSRPQYEELGFGGLVDDRSFANGLADFFGKSTGDDADRHISLTSGVRRHQVDFVLPSNSRITLQLLLQDFQKLEIPAVPFDAIYFDPFAPDVNQKFWQAEYLAKMFPLLRPGGSLVSYCVKSAVQRSLRDAGFEVCAVGGPAGGKREVLIANRPE